MPDDSPHPLCPWCKRPVELVAPKITPCSAFCDEHGFVYVLPPDQDLFVPDRHQPPPRYSQETPPHED